MTGPLTAMKSLIGAGLAHAALQRYLGQDVVPQIAQRAAGVGVVVGLFLLGINPQVLLYVLLYRDPAVVDIDGRAKY